MHIALVAHDRRKDELMALARLHRWTLEDVQITATANTGQRLAELGVVCDRVHSGPAGGDLEIGCKVVRGQLDAVVFLQDRDADHIHATDIASLLRICRYYGVPLAETVADAHRLLSQLALVQALKAGENPPEMYAGYRTFAKTA